MAKPSATKESQKAAPQATKGTPEKKAATAKAPVVDEDTCIGCMACVNECETVFQMNDSGKAEVYAPEGDTKAGIQAAMDICPVQAISWK